LQVAGVERPGELAKNLFRQKALMVRTARPLRETPSRAQPAHSHSLRNCASLASPPVAAQVEELDDHAICVSDQKSFEFTWGEHVANGGDKVLIDTDRY
jgi:hypothetical protein